MTTDFQVKIGDFEGPLPLLLALIEKHKLHISQVSLAQVADDYVELLQRDHSRPIAEMANFILVASTLMLIKSLSLLPGLTLTPEESASVDELERQLKHYQKIKELVPELKARFGQEIIFEREVSREHQPVFTPSEEIKSAGLLSAIRNIIANLPKVEKLPATIIKKVISLEEVMTDLASRISRSIKMRFSDYVGEKKHEKVNVIVSFLGMLELVKQGSIDVRQETHFDDIDIETTVAEVPKY
ncbi:MAG: hypothetical protein A2370_01940 [Candidatus Vogelbacteria bacterium RIFOXYB1_FULL_42_16]|uniref:Segregation and condensation protein A n=1 Tax=Candidatus Vogelbacteria bacterium RIFOXYB1_FULL_42_16 TaxID=1802436 RepID=A0A1G2QGT4_9BACT|nr:MAG: hypothetical protein A2370_01940 [Candidatus Vogelbacteria bacterium RIFOXYB1_FULL_42_16]